MERRAALLRIAARSAPQTKNPLTRIFLGDLGVLAILAPALSQTCKTNPSRNAYAERTVFAAQLHACNVLYPPLLLLPSLMALHRAPMINVPQAVLAAGKTRVL
jgi:hypothetical protein